VFRAKNKLILQQQGLKSLSFIINLGKIGAEALGKEVSVS
jgi:hypothetical protein